MLPRLRKAIVPAAVVVGGWLVGSTVAAGPAEAASTERSGWKCSTDDTCVSGTKQCCEVITHCTTICPVCTPNPCDDET
jgi:hypothetical protein